MSHRRNDSYACASLLYESSTLDISSCKGTRHPTKVGERKSPSFPSFCSKCFLDAEGSNQKYETFYKSDNEVRIKNLKTQQCGWKRVGLFASFIHSSSSSSPTSFFLVRFVVVLSLLESLSSSRYSEARWRKMRPIHDDDDNRHNNEEERAKPGPRDTGSQLSSAHPQNRALSFLASSFFIKKSFLGGRSLESLIRLPNSFFSSAHLRPWTRNERRRYLRTKSFSLAEPARCCCLHCDVVELGCDQETRVNQPIDYLLSIFRLVFFFLFGVILNSFA